MAETISKRKKERKKKEERILYKEKDEDEGEDEDEDDGAVTQERAGQAALPKRSRTRACRCGSWYKRGKKA